MIRCTKCQEFKPFDQFRKAKFGRHGRETQCKICRSEQMHKYSLANPEKLRESTRRYRMKNRENIHVKRKIYDQTHKEQRMETQRKRRVANPEKYLALTRK